MKGKIICCGILKDELDYLTRGRDTEVLYIDAALHVDFNRLAGALKDVLNNAGGEGALLVIGGKCHPDMEKMTAECGGRLVGAGNCIEMLLGDKMAEVDAESRTFYLTSGWLDNWRKIFIEGLKWDGIDARQNFGYYDRILLLDTGVVPIDEEKVLEFYDYTQVPVEIMQVGLDNLRKLLEQQRDG